MWPNVLAILNTLSIRFDARDEQHLLQCIRHGDIDKDAFTIFPRVTRRAI